jgi:thiamine transporter ThiT
VDGYFPHERETGGSSQVVGIASHKVHRGHQEKIFRWLNDVVTVVSVVRDLLRFLHGVLFWNRSAGEPLLAETS